jgi:Thiamine pyrophosphate enzyme, C-terminal TPP binding domain
LEWFAKILHAENVPGLRVPAIDFCSLAKAYGVDAAHRANTIEELRSTLQKALMEIRPVLIEVETLFKILTSTCLRSRPDAEISVARSPPQVDGADGRPTLEETGSVRRSAQVTIRGRDIDDAALALWKHHAQFMLHAQHCAEHIGVESCRIALGGLRRQRTGLAFGPGVVDRHIQASEARNGLIDQASHIIFVAHVGTPIFGLCAQAAEFSD